MKDRSIWANVIKKQKKQKMSSSKVLNEGMSDLSASVISEQKQIDYKPLKKKGGAFEHIIEEKDDLSSLSSS